MSRIISFLAVFFLAIKAFGQPVANLMSSQFVSPALVGAKKTDELIIGLTHHKISPGIAITSYVLGIDKTIYSNAQDHFSGWMAILHQDLSHQLSEFRWQVGGAYHRNLSGRFDAYKHQIGAGAQFQLSQWSQRNNNGWVSNQYDVGNLSVDYNLPTGETLDLGHNFRSLGWQVDGGAYYRLTHRRWSLQIAPSLFGLNRPKFKNEYTWWEQNILFRIFSEAEWILNKELRFGLYGWYQRQDVRTDVLSGVKLIMGNPNDETRMNISFSVLRGSAPEQVNNPLRSWLGLGLTYKAYTLDAGYGLSLQKINDYGTPFTLVGKYRLDYQEKY